MTYDYNPSPTLNLINFFIFILSFPASSLITSFTFFFGSNIHSWFSNVFSSINLFILPKEIFSREYQPPITNGTGVPRKNLKKAKKILEEEGWSITNGKLQKNGRPFEFEFLIISPSLEKIALAFKKNLETLGDI